MTFKLTSAQQRALDYVYQKATQNKKHDRERIQKILTSHEIACNVADILKAIGDVSHLTTNFHPDRLLIDGRSVITALYEEGYTEASLKPKSRTP